MRKRCNSDLSVVLVGFQRGRDNPVVRPKIVLTGACLRFFFVCVCVCVFILFSSCSAHAAISIFDFYPIVFLYFIPFLFSFFFSRL